jgi:SAM-dependent methyltransferase
VDGVRAFYDELAPIYHLIFRNWDTSIAYQGEALASLITERWGSDARVVLDAAVGIGTQALGLLARGWHVTGSDLSRVAVQRASREADARGLSMPCVVADFRALPFRSACADMVIVCDNALPHLETEREIAGALAECHRCARPGGGCVISMRDYGAPPPSGTVEIHPYGERDWNGRRHRLRQVWRWAGRRYDVRMELAPVETPDTPVRVLETTYFAIEPARVAALMTAAGFTDVRRIDGRFYQPLLVGTRARQT